MKPKTLILMVVAVTCGLGASYMTSRLLAERQPDVETEKVTILVTKKNLDMGTIIKNVDDLFEEKKFTKGEEPKNAIIKIDDLKKRFLKRSLRQGDHVTNEDLLNDNDGTLQALMAQGYRAVGIRVNLESIAAGFASLPLSRVDIIATVRRATDKDSFSMVLLDNVLVLAADQRTMREENNGAMPATIVTVALKPEDALKVTLAREMGPLSLVLRKYNDTNKTDIARVTVEDIMTNTAGKRDIEENTWVQETSQPPVAKIDIPELPKTEPKSVDVVAKVEVPAAPKGTLHRMRLIEGDRERVVEYWLDDNGQVIQNDVVRSELGGAARPPQMQPRPQGSEPTAQPKGSVNDDN